MCPRWSPVVLLAALALAACARPHPPQPPQVLQYREAATAKTPIKARPRAPRAEQDSRAGQQRAQGGPYSAEPPYTLDTGDRLRIIVFGQQNLSSVYAVDAGGRIAMPLIGSVEARGRTPQQLARSVAAALQRGFMRDPSVSAEVVTYRPFFILGEVNNPGQYPYVAHMTVETAVAIAGGYSPRGSTGEVKISRTVNGATTRFKAPTTFKIRPGDTIRVKERWF